MKKKIHLDAYEQEIEAHLEDAKPLKNESKLKEHLIDAARAHLKNKKSITLRVSVSDLEAIKIKASKSGLAYQTYINVLIHKDASRI